MLRTRIKWIGGSKLGEDSDGEFSYIISSWLIEERQKPTVMTLYITTFAQLPQKNIGVFNGSLNGLLQYFIGIAMLTRFGEAC